MNEHVTREFELPQWTGRRFRVRSRSANWVADVPRRMAVIEATGTGNFEGIWQDFLTIRELEVNEVKRALSRVPDAP
jgi:protein involved in temperature-dependent protein secretion